MAATIPLNTRNGVTVAMIPVPNRTSAAMVARSCSLASLSQSVHALNGEHTRASTKIDVAIVRVRGQCMRTPSRGEPGLRTAKACKKCGSRGAQRAEQK
jgi:hypothetical protein